MLPTSGIGKGIVVTSNSVSGIRLNESSRAEPAHTLYIKDYFRKLGNLQSQAFLINGSVPLNNYHLYNNITANYVLFVHVLIKAYLFQSSKVESVKDALDQLVSREEIPDYTDAKTNQDVTVFKQVSFPTTSVFHHEFIKLAENQNLIGFKNFAIYPLAYCILYYMELCHSPHFVVFFVWYVNCSC